jgi:hypothetical protein
MRHLLIIGIACAFSAAGAGINGPVSGFVLDGAAHAIRPVNGMPGSALQGAPLPLPFSVGLAAISARLDYALVTDTGGDGTPVVALGLRGGTPQIAAIEGAIPADGIVLSDSGDTAALYSNGSARLQFLTGLPGEPRAGDPIDIRSVAGGVAALALDPQGRNALLAAGDGGIYWVSGRTALNWIAQVPGAGSAAFLTNGSDAVVGSRTSGDVLLLHDPGGSLSISTLTGARDGISSAVAVRPVYGSEVAVVDGTGRLAAVDVNSSTVTWIDLSGAADRLETLGGGLLVLNSTGPQPLLVLDISQGRTAYFIPPAAGSGLQEQKRVPLHPVHGIGKNI